ncbi:formate dehydrogenase accessory protein FdhE [uncultured Thiodictyon sp.]|uniref:formate dehydrogenase accessory protein FdhE domain-containing protein n=1 Tax=uncultured Thiodictyon sp. TaxID=1846217 RepID=UPI0025CCF35A|nr:formate dehydrogenase accessory protein FdhE [uncultured Thiodictyon sp.]
MTATPTIHTPSAPPTLLTPAPDLFARRADRLRQLAPAQALGPWLDWLAALCTAQHRAFEQEGSVPHNDIGATTAMGSAALLGRIAAIRWTLISALPTDRCAGVGPRWELAPSDLASHIERNLLLAQAATIGTGRDYEDVLTAAAMQVAWTADARRSQAVGTAADANAGTCPHCGSAALGSILLAGGGLAGLRYQECCLCGCRWNTVRARCTLCAAGSVVDYLSLEDAHPAVAAETCDQCHGYTKLFFQSKAIQVEPLADDVATLALDVLVGERGYARTAPNLFLCEGEAA